MFPTSRYANYQHLKIEVENKDASVTLNRPESRNAINQCLIRELRTIWDDLADDMRARSTRYRPASRRRPSPIPAWSRESRS